MQDLMDDKEKNDKDDSGINVNQSRKSYKP